MLPFTKMHGLGNDYVYIDGFAHRVSDPESLARAIADRHRGVGGDGLILIEPPDAGSDAHVAMRMFNGDGSESEMCGNGVRCVAKYAIDHGLAKARPIRVKTARGILSIDYTLDAGGKVEQATVDMGEPILDLASIPVDAKHLLAVTPRGKGFAGTLAVGTECFEAIFVSMGNPHAVIFVPDVAAVELARIGPGLERHPAFPRRVNVHVVEVRSSDEVIMRTWERGSGITQACGTGASAVCVAGVLCGRTARTLLAHLPGGDLVLEWRDLTNHVFMTGPAVEVFSGVWTDGGQR